MKKKDFIIWFDNHIKYYKPFLGIDLQEIKIKYDSEVNYLSIGLSYPYLNPTIYFGEKAFEDFKNNKITKQTVLHELCHILTDPLYVKATQRYVSTDEIEAERERLTDTIGNIINNLLEGNK